MEYYDFKLKRLVCFLKKMVLSFVLRVLSWKQLTPVQSWRSCTALVGHKHNIYLLGGEEVDPESPTGSRTVNRVTRYDCERQRWSGGPSMLLARRWSGALVVNNTLYCIGNNSNTFYGNIQPAFCYIAINMIEYRRHRGQGRHVREAAGHGGVVGSGGGGREAVAAAGQYVHPAILPHL